MGEPEIAGERTLLKATRVSKVYREGVTALSDVDLELHGGHIYGLLGRNGAGKTTLLRICATLIAPTSGDVWVGSCHTQTHAREVRAQLGYLSATTGIYQRLTPDELMRYVGRLYGMTSTHIQSRTDQIFRDLGIQRYRTRLIGGLSTGMAQKVSLARTILPDPRIIILDEPTNGLDVMVRQTLLDLLRSLVGPDRLIILSTHDLPEAEQLCDRYVIIDSGRIAAQGTREDLLGAHPHGLRDVFFNAIEGGVEE